MNFCAAPTDIAAASDPLGAADYRDVLDELIGLGMDMARLVHQEARAAADTDAAGPPGAVAEAVVAFDRIARAVRRTVMLARRLDAPVAEAGAERSRALARRRVIRAVEDTIQRDAAPGDAERMAGELAERMDAPELDDELDTRPVGEIVVEICRDLGLTVIPGSRAFKRRTPAEVAALCERAGRVGVVGGDEGSGRWEPGGRMVERGPGRVPGAG